LLLAPSSRVGTSLRLVHSGIYRHSEDWVQEEVDLEAARSVAGCFQAGVRVHHISSRLRTFAYRPRCSLDPIKAGLAKARRQAQEEESGAILRRLRARVKHVAKTRAAQLQKQLAPGAAALRRDAEQAGDSDFASSEWDSDIASINSALSLSRMMRAPSPAAAPAANSPPSGPSSSSPISTRSDKSRVLSSVL